MVQNKRQLSDECMKCMINTVTDLDDGYWVMFALEMRTPGNCVSGLEASDYASWLHPAKSSEAEENTLAISVQCFQPSHEGVAGR